MKERLDWAKGLAGTVSLAGGVLVSGVLDPAAWRLNLLGIITGILSGLWYAIYTLMGRSASQRGLNPWTTLLYTFGFGMFFLLAFNLFLGGVLPGAATRPGRTAAPVWGWPSPKPSSNCTTGQFPPKTIPARGQRSRSDSPNKIRAD